MHRALILVADGSEEIEFVTVYDVLVRAGFEVVSVGVELKEEYARMSRNLRILPEYPSLDSLPSTSLPPATYFSTLLIPGGAPGAKTMSQSPQCLQLIHDFRAAGKWVGAICAGTLALVAAQEHHGGETPVVTSHPSVKGEIEGKVREYSEERVVVDGEQKIVTSRSPGTALGWALMVVELLAGKEKRDEVGGPMILAETL